MKITITNSSGVTITGLKADLPKAPPLQWLPGLSGTGWDCQGASGLSCLPADRTLSPGESTVLAPSVTTPASAETHWHATVHVTGDGMDQPPVDFTIGVRRTGATAASAFGFAPANVF